MLNVCFHAHNYRLETHCFAKAFLNSPARDEQRPLDVKALAAAAVSVCHVAGRIRRLVVRRLHCRRRLLLLVPLLLLLLLLLLAVLLLLRWEALSRVALHGGLRRVLLRRHRWLLIACHREKQVYCTRTARSKACSSTALITPRLTVS